MGSQYCTKRAQMGSQTNIVETKKKYFFYTHHPIYIFSLYSETVYARWEGLLCLVSPWRDFAQGYHCQIAGAPRDEQGHGRLSRVAAPRKPRCFINQVSFCL